MALFDRIATEIVDEIRGPPGALPSARSLAGEQASLVAP